MKQAFLQCMKILYPEGVKSREQLRDLVRCFGMGWAESMQCIGNALPVIGGKRRIVCEAFMKTVPMEVRQGLYQPAGVDSRRVAVRTILQLAAKHKAAAQQLTFKL